jgi:hypothetical protein
MMRSYNANEGYRIWFNGCGLQCGPKKSGKYLTAN